MLVGQFALAVLFVFAASTKLRDRRRWRNGVGEFLGHDGALVLPVAVAVPAAEILVAAALLTPGHRYAAAAALVLLAGFSVGVGANLARGRSVSCNCFGSDGPAGWSTIGRNLVLAGVAVLAAGWSIPLAAALAVLGVPLLATRLRKQPVSTLEAAAEGELAPAFELESLTGRESLAGLLARRKPVLLIFSDPHCGPCNLLLPELAKWQRHARDVTIALVSKGTVAENRAKASDYGIVDVLVQGELDVAALYGVQGTPIGMLVNRDGTIGSEPAPGQFAIEALITPLLELAERPMSRRKLLGGALAAATMGVVGSFPSLASADNAGCVAPRVSCGGCCCGPGEICVKKACQCPAGSTACSGGCVDLTADAQNCGACGHSCAPGMVCQGGQCVCVAPLSACNGACVNRASDPSNCGACGSVCPAGQFCVNGICTTPTCPGGTTSCNGACVDTAHDPSNCGACGHLCPAGLACINGACSCPNGTQNCNGTCIETSADSMNCGHCGTVCGPGQVCVNGVCSTTCQNGLANCSGVCTNITTDPFNCGGCGHACPANLVCINGACSCPNGTQNCNGTCIEVSADSKNCGACGTVCAAGQVCSTGCAR